MTRCQNSRHFLSLFINKSAFFKSPPSSIIYLLELQNYLIHCFLFSSRPGPDGIHYSLTILTPKIWDREISRKLAKKMNGFT